MPTETSYIRAGGDHALMASDRLRPRPHASLAPGISLHFSDLRGCLWKTGTHPPARWISQDGVPHEQLRVGGSQVSSRIGIAQRTPTRHSKRGAMTRKIST